MLFYNTLNIQGQSTFRTIKDESYFGCVLFPRFSNFFFLIHMRNLSLLEDKRRKGTCHATSGNLQLWKYQSCAQNKKKKERKKQRFT